MAPPPRYDADLREAKEVDVEREAKEKLAREKEAFAAEHAALQDKVKVLSYVCMYMYIFMCASLLNDKHITTTNMYK